MNQNIFHVILCVFQINDCQQEQSFPNKSPNAGTLSTSSANDYGVHYPFELPIQGPNGKTKIVVVAFQIDHDKDMPKPVANNLK